MKLRNVLIGCGIVLVVLCIGGGAVLYFGGKAAVNLVTEGPYSIGKRPLPTGQDASTILPQTVGAFKRDGDVAQGAATYSDGTSTVAVAMTVAGSAADAQAAVASAGAATTSENSTNRILITGIDPSYYKVTVGGASQMTYSRGAYLFNVTTTSEAALDKFMGAFPY